MSQSQKQLCEQANQIADPSKPTASNRPQFFEGHGTGIVAGDPSEVEAFVRAFFGDGYALKHDGEPLYAGSIKSILSHTESTASVAALLKASLALKHTTVPPNMLPNNLSGFVAPFTKTLQILQQGKPWTNPITTSQCEQLRAWRYNTHALLENYDSAPRCSSQSSFDDQHPVGPFVLSALSRQSLTSSLSAHADYLQANPLASLLDLAYNLHKRRLAFAASTAENLASNITAELDGTTIEELGVGFSAPSAGKRGKLLAVFIGQGAQ
ncbi:hypothetical protein BDV11DRAFT_175605 [Aspergillus similis]